MQIRSKAMILTGLLGVGSFAVWSSSYAVQGSEPDLLERARQIKQDVEERVQKNILDPILGVGRAMVIADVELELLTQKQSQKRQGTGLSEKYKEKKEGGGYQTQYVLPGIPRPKSVLGGSAPEKPEMSQGQQAQQEKQLVEERSSVKPIIKRFLVTVFHDDRIVKNKIEEVRQGIVDALSSYKVQPNQIVFKPKRFSGNPWDVLTQPGVFVPLIFALLLFLLLLFLFGPVTSFLRSYLRTMQESRGTEVQVDSKFEGGAGGGGAGEDSPTDKVMNFVLQRKKGEEEEDDPMKKKFEPFVYINEENLKRLAYLLLKEEPWVSAVVISYLNPDFARKVLTALPVELQAKVAMETATIRQVTREQVEAIDIEIKEKVNFILGGIEHLMAMLEDTDEATRQNILEYLRNEKPAIYDKVRKAILAFEDIPSFPDREVQTIIRELKTEDMAKAIHGASPEMMNKFLSNMSTGAAALLKEAVEYTTENSPAQISEVRKRIMDVIKRLEKEGKITVREKVDTNSLEGLVEEVSVQETRDKKWAVGGTKAGGPGSSEEAVQYLNAGVGHYEAGRYEECLTYFQYALNQDPSLWQAHQYLGGALYALGKRTEALAHYEELIRLNPDPALKQWVENFKATAMV
ncbi:MAG: tetratricopeptide repeat protein [Elusimicrobia bacterium]|nr:tetratricopeptide repeat protein [Elusimicrobiota bacterium]